MKEKGDLILLYTLKELPAAKSHSLTKSIPSFVVDSVSNSDLNSPTSTEKFEPLIDQLTQEVDSNNVDGEEQPQNKIKKQSLQDQLEEVKKKKEECCASKKYYSKDHNTSSNRDLYPRNTIVMAGDSIINEVFEGRLHRKNHMVMVQNFPSSNVEDILQNVMPIISKKPCHLIIHAGTNDAKRFTSRDILDNCWIFKKSVIEQVSDCWVIILTRIIRPADGKAGLTVSQLTNHVRQFKN